MKADTFALFCALSISVALLASVIQPTEMVAEAFAGTVSLSERATEEVQAISVEVPAKIAERCKATVRSITLAKTLAKRAVNAQDRERALAVGTMHAQIRNQLIAAANH